MAKRSVKMCLCATQSGSVAVLGADSKIFVIHKVLICSLLAANLVSCSALQDVDFYVKS